MGEVIPRVILQRESDGGDRGLNRDHAVLDGVPQTGKEREEILLSLSLHREHKMRERDLSVTISFEVFYLVF